MICVPITLQPIPAQHAYVRGIRPEGGWRDITILGDPLLDPAEPGRWWPHPALEAPWWDDHHADVVHLHFGFEHLGVDGTRDFIAALQKRGIPLVFTVHDVDNPHLVDQSEYHRQLELLIGHAAHVLTLSSGAAEYIVARFGRRPQVVAHPVIARNQVDQPRTSGRAAVFLKSLRGNVVTDPDFYRALGAEIYLHEDAPALSDIADHVHSPMDDDQLYRAVSSHPAVVLPYVRGSHSGWMRMCRDLGVRVAVPDCGFYASQASDLNDPGVAVYRTGDGHSAAEAVERLLADPPAGALVLPDDKNIHDAHRVIYQKVTGTR